MTIKVKNFGVGTLIALKPVMKCRYLIRLTILATLMLTVVSVANAINVGTLKLETVSGVYPGKGGGEFTTIIESGPNYVTNYAAVATHTYNGTKGFETFCVEVGVSFKPNTTLYYNLSDETMPITPKGGGRGEDLSLGTAWLYYEFAKGVLGDFDYTYGSDREADDNLLQAAIWALEGGQTYAGYPSVTSPDTYYYLNSTGKVVKATSSDNIYYAEALAEFGGSLTEVDSAYTGNSVKILNLWDNSLDTLPAQNQLVCTGDTTPSYEHVPVPDGGMTIVLLGGALAGLQTLRRKLWLRIL